MLHISPYLRPVGVEIENLGCDRGGVPVLRGVSLNLKPGEGVQLFGDNGSGKSSLLYTLGGMIKPVEGRISWRSDHRSCDAGERLFLGHETGVKSALTAIENLKFWARVGCSDADETKMHDALGLLGLDGLQDMRTAHFSAGQKRRVDLARLLVVRCPVWLLDEPATALDPVGVSMLAQIIENHLDAGGIVIAATHEKLDFSSRRLEIG